MVKRKIHQMIDCSHPTKRKMSVKQQVFQRSIKALPHLIYKILITLVNTYLQIYEQ